MKQISIFDESSRLESLSELGDPLEKLNDVIDWKQFLSILDSAFKRDTKVVGGRPPYSYLMMFKILVLQRLFNISDDQTEYQIKDRMTFMRFLGLTLSDRVPDAKTIWLFREKLTNIGVVKELFDVFERQLARKGIITRKGSIVDASFVDVPRQRNTREENRQIKEGRIPEEWKKPDNINKLRQKDTAARWAKKGEETHFGYKMIPIADADSKLISDYSVVTANVHDSQKFVDLIRPGKDNVVYADSAFIGEEIARRVQEKATKKKRKVKLMIVEKGSRNHPLSAKQKRSNRKLSKVRCRIEHIFATITNSMKGITLRTIGMVRAEFNIGLTCLVYNMCRYVSLSR